MLFWCFVLLAILGIGLTHVYNNTRVGEWCLCTGVATAVLCVLAIFISLIMYAGEHFGVEGTIAANQQRYESLVYQYENNIYDNDNDLGKKELMKEIQDWNEDLARAQANQDDFWIGVYYADIYGQFKFIELNHE